MHRRTSAAKWQLSDLLALAMLRPLDGAYVPWNSWSLRPAVLVTVLNEIAHHGRRSVVEFGSGASTLYLGRLLRERGGRLVAVEHDARWAGHVAQLVADEGLDACVAVVHAPLAPWTTADDAPPGFGHPSRWYDGAIVAAALRAPVDLVLVDGPPGGADEHVLNRYPALGAVRAALSDDATVVLDDADRAAEQATAAAWERALGREFELIERLGIAVVRGDGEVTLAL